ncbi:hypothetical protein KIW84_033882 [Lathyrus oleraceus]|uniref:Uncharacterized protein n=1 Tax=Pisum sativum TaxID=3888 RepID=A0A9D4Y192_PEA|nr:hypothetical protein KIW84_033882 [Pisum sativum]
MIMKILRLLLRNVRVTAFIIQYQATICPIIEVESMLLDHEAKLDRSKKRTLIEPMSVNVTQTTLAPPQVVSQVQTDPSQLMPHNYMPNCTTMPNFADNHGGFCGGRSFGRTRGGRFGGRFKVKY